MSNAPVRDPWIDHLRAFVTVLVVLHHAAMAYACFAHFNTDLYIASTHPVTDSARWKGFDLFIAANDTFFMPLMFLLSGLFFYSARCRRGARGLLKERFRRLAVPFLFAEVFLIPFAYLPAWFLAGGQPDLGHFMSDYVFRQQWPVGPPWFIWLLLVFNVFALLLPPQLFRWLAAGLQRRPVRTVFLWWLLSLLSLVPLSIWLGRYAWTGFGPFDFQANRVGFYLIYFLTGAALGCMDWQAHVFKNNRLAAFPAGLCLALALVLFAVLEILTYRGWGAGPDRIGAGVLEILLAAICPFSCLALMWFFRRYAQRPAVLSNSLVANAFGIYLCHYPLLIWLQYLLLGLSLPAVVKFFLVSAGSLAGSWVLTALLRRLRPINKIL